MRSFKICITGLSFLLFFASCDKGFLELNTDPNSVTSDRFDPNALFLSAQLFTANDVSEQEPRMEMQYMGTFVQQFASLNGLSSSFAGDKYAYSGDVQENLWKSSYKVIKYLQDILHITQDKPEYHNLVQMTRILKVYIFQRLTDVYGDVPYFEAGLAYYEGIVKPKYDKQQDIYHDMLSELEDAVSKLNSSLPIFGDIMYEGNIEKWRRLGNSLMLRLGMRLTRVAPDEAKTWAKKASDAGVFQSNSDNLVFFATDKNGTNLALTNEKSYQLTVGSGRTNDGLIAETFFSFLKDHDDPRFRYTVALYPKGADYTAMTTDPAVQKGLPNGYNASTILNHPGYDPSAPAGHLQYSKVNRDTYAQLDGPRMLVTHAEVAFLLAEAAVRGWISGDAKVYYESGVRSAMKLLSVYKADVIITDSEISDYLTRNPFVGTSDVEAALEQINTQYWAATFMEAYEGFANIRRSGYPALVPVKYPGAETQGGIGALGDYPGRLRYPESEYTENYDNVMEAVTRQGPDNFSTKVWWAKN